MEKKTIFTYKPKIIMSKITNSIFFLCSYADIYGITSKVLERIIHGEFFLRSIV